MAQTKEKENTVPAARAKQNAAAAPAAAGEKRPRTTRRPYYNRRPRRPQQPKEAATPIHIYPLGGLCLLYTSPSPRDRTRSRMPSSA